MSHFATAPLSLSRDTSDDSSSGQTPLLPPSSSTKRTPLPENSQRKPRGRPPGSKNKPKPPVFITKHTDSDSDSSIKPAILEISAGADIIHSIIKFATKNHVGVTVLSATGSVSNVTLRHPNAHAPSLSLHGPFNLLALCGSFLGGSSCLSFGISLAGAQGQVFGGIVAGKVVAASQVVVVAATFRDPVVHRVPRGGDEAGEEDEEEGDEEMSKVESMSVYGNVANPTPINCQIAPDTVHWAHHY
ncbi:AT-hook motif nuclear-localized protein 15-like [Euphorbia lathyris]|uniref:AT-hook motif nuclear-localized protein 15-like n=1 Tax=Euphorbia lathyris TaxID=212925 RepID=UPI0033133EC0